MHRKWMVWISIPCRQVNDFADFANFEWITWEKRGDAGGVAQAGSNSEIHEVHRWQEDSLDCPQCGFWFEDFASMHFGWCNIETSYSLKHFERFWKQISMNEHEWAMGPAFEICMYMSDHECMKLLAIGSNEACYCLWTSGWATSDVFRHSWMRWSCQPIQSFSVLFICVSITVWTQTMIKFAPSSGHLRSAH